MNQIRKGIASEQEGQALDWYMQPYGNSANSEGYIRMKGWFTRMQM
jgi:hypothetical protein